MATCGLRSVLGRSACCGDGLLGRLAQRLGGRNVEARLCEDLATLCGIGALEAHDERHFDAERGGRSHHALCDEIAAYDASEDVHENGADRRIAQDELEGLLDLLLVGPA